MYNPYIQVKIISFLKACVLSLQISFQSIPCTRHDPLIPLYDFFYSILYCQAVSIFSINTPTISTFSSSSNSSCSSQQPPLLLRRRRMLRRTGPACRLNNSRCSCSRPPGRLGKAVPRRPRSSQRISGRAIAWTTVAALAPAASVPPWPRSDGPQPLLPARWLLSAVVAPRQEPAAPDRTRPSAVRSRRRRSLGGWWWLRPTPTSASGPR